MNWLKSSDYYYAAVYVVSVLGFVLAAEPKVGEDYLRVAALAWTVITFIRIVEVAVVYTKRWNFLDPKHRTRMLKPWRVWGMGVAYFLAVIGIVDEVIELWGGPLRWDGAPLLIATLAAATVWLWPLTGYERNLAARERANLGS